MKTRKLRLSKHTPCPAEDLDALLGVVEGELRGLILLTLLTRHPPRELVRLKWKDVVPLVEQLSSYFSTANQSRQPDALLFPGMAMLPRHLLGTSGGARIRRFRSMATAYWLFTRALRAAEESSKPA
jgi:hypothetical protein